jgi:putative endonuclease
MTDDLQKRLNHHNHPIDPLKFTARGLPWEIFLFLPCQSKSQALKLERLIKSKKSRVFIENLRKYPELVRKIIEQASDC